MPAATPASPAPVIKPEDIISIEQLAERLHTSVSWVREKIPARCQNPIPCYNIGRAIVFEWPVVSDWIRNSPRPIYRRRAKRKPRLKVAA